MKKIIFINFSIILFLCTSIVAGGESKRLIIENFEDGAKYNLTGGLNKNFFSGDVKKKAPWCMSKTIKSKGRGKVLKIDYDVSIGKAGFVLNISDKKFFHRFNEIGFFIRGDADTLKVELNGKDVHEYIVEGITDKWQEIIIPYENFSKYKLLSPKSIFAIQIVLDNKLLDNKKGTLFIDDISLSTFRRKKFILEGLNKPSKILKINDASISRMPYQAQKFNIVSKYSYAKKDEEFLGIRFEASTDNRYWFYIGSDLIKDDSFFSAEWDAKYFEGGIYYLRAVALFKHSNWVAGKEIKIKIENDFDFLDFLDQIERKSFYYFLSEQDKETSLIKQSTLLDAPFDTQACGLALSAFCVGAERNFITRADAASYVLNILNTFINDISYYYGFYPKYINKNYTPFDKGPSGDILATTYLIAGALTVSQYFDKQDDITERTIRQRANLLCKNVQWKRALSVDEGKKYILAQRVFKDGKVSGCLEGYSEAILSYILAISSPNLGISASSWDAWTKTYTFSSYSVYKVLENPSLLVHQIPHIWLDLDEETGPYVDYYNNSILITFINREFSLKENSYSGEIWGLTPCVGPRGYYAYGAPPPKSNVHNDGTICPSASGSSIIFTPTLSKAALYSLYDKYGDKIWGKYGFYESFNPKDSYYKEFYTAINAGNLILQIENYRSGLLQKLFIENKNIKTTLKRIGFK